jgi:phage terminase small subunit
MAKKIDVYKLALENTTPQQQKFAAAFCLCLNATKAALTAGYSEKTARQQASRLLTNVYIKTLIQHTLAAAGADPEEIAARWDRIARVDLSDFYTRQLVEYTPKIAKPLREVVEEYRRYVEFEEAVSIRSEELISDAKLRGKFRKRQRQLAVPRELKLLRLEMELENDPDGIRVVDGPTRLREELRLDLVKAQELGILDLAKGLTEGRNGTGLTLRDPDAALDKLAQWRGMLKNHVDITSQGEPVAQAPILGVLTLEQKKELLAAKRKAAAQVGEGQANA